jgi:hypothetical protein
MDIVRKNMPLRTAAYVVVGLGLVAFTLWLLLMAPVGSFFGTKW